MKFCPVFFLNVHVYSWQKQSRILISLLTRKVTLNSFAIVILPRTFPRVGGFELRFMSCCEIAFDI